MHQYWDSEDTNSDDFQKWEEHYPHDEDRFSLYIYLSEEELDELPAIIFDMYDELRVTLNNDLNVLAGIGLRMVVEAVCIKQDIPGRNLKNKIQSLLEVGLISKNDFEVIDKLREIGNVSTHQIKGPSATVLEASLEAVNHLLRTVFVVQKRTRKLRIKNS
ncbi:DUF4145 domain-containing protein [Ekhidna sp.]|uniref:DUF4145 domain-containing protein n=1 Tax=Ekhidna sp. TaxID=2608089 RepID=UPI003297D22B